MRPSVGTILTGILVLGILLGFALFSALLGQTAAGPTQSSPAAGATVAPLLRAGCSGDRARLDPTQVSAQADGVHIDMGSQEPGVALRFRNDTGYVVSPGVNRYGPSVIPLSPGRWYAACVAQNVKTFSGGVPLLVRDDGNFYVPAEPQCDHVNVVQANTDRAWTDPEREIRRVAAVSRSDVVEPAGYVGLADDRDRYESYTYRIVRGGVIVGRVRVSRDGLSIFGCVDARA